MDLTVAGTKLLNARRARKLTQTEAATQVGVTQSRISQIETGAKLDLVTIMKLCTLYGIAVEDLIGRISGNRTEVQDAISLAAELSASDREFLMAMYEFMRQRGPLAEPSLSKTKYDVSHLL